jgi:hypothetical protein
MLHSQSFEIQYPAIARFVDTIGRIEIGLDDYISAFVRAYDQGGTVYEGKDSYPSMEAAFEDLEAGIQAYFDEHGI